MSFWCPKTLASIEERNTLELIRLWNSRPGRIARRSRWFGTLRFRANA